MSHSIDNNRVAIFWSALASAGLFFPIEIYGVVALFWLAHASVNVGIPVEFLWAEVRNSHAGAEFDIVVVSFSEAFFEDDALT